MPEGGTVAASAAPASGPAGLWTDWPHWGHLPRLPAAAPDTLRLLPQLEQVTTIKGKPPGRTTTSRTQYNDYFRLADAVKQRRRILTPGIPWHRDRGRGTMR